MAVREQVQACKSRLASFHASRAKEKLDLERMAYDRLGQLALTGGDLSDLTEGLAALANCVTEAGARRCCLPAPLRRALVTCCCLRAQSTR